jgi:hypothetical protein
MPYIDPRDRENQEEQIEELSDALLTDGHLNYAITRLVHEWIAHRGESYETYNAAVGVLECAKLELYRRRVAPYEDRKIAENGDV